MNETTKQSIKKDEEIFVCRPNTRVAKEELFSRAFPNLILSGLESNLS